MILPLFKASSEIFLLAVKLYVSFPLSLRNAEDLLHEQGVDVRALEPPRTDMPHVTKEALRDQVKRTELLAEQMQIAWSNDWLEGLKRTNRSLEHNPVPTWFLTATTGDPKSKICTEAFSVVVQTVTDMRLRS